MTDLNQAIERIKAIMAMDTTAMTPADKLKLTCEASEIGLKFQAVRHDCALGTLLDGLEALRADLEA